jgi:hypothetical protein
VCSPEFFSTAQVCDNPIYQKKKRERIEADRKSIHHEESSEDKLAIRNKNRSTNIQSDKLDKLIDLQENNYIVSELSGYLSCSQRLDGFWQFCLDRNILFRKYNGKATELDSG